MGLNATAATFLPNSEISAGGTGYQPVPSGHWPDGMRGGGIAKEEMLNSRAEAADRSLNRATGKLEVVALVFRAAGAKAISLQHKQTRAPASLEKLPKFQCGVNYELMVD